MILKPIHRLILALLLGLLIPACENRTSLQVDQLLVGTWILQKREPNDNRTIEHSTTFTSDGRAHSETKLKRSNGVVTNLHGEGTWRVEGKVLISTTTTVQGTNTEPSDVRMQILGVNDRELVVQVAETLWHYQRKR